MEPVIHENQLVIKRLIGEGEDLKIGEIYAYQREGIFGKEMAIHSLHLGALAYVAKTLTR